MRLQESRTNRVRTVPVFRVRALRLLLPLTLLLASQLALADKTDVIYLHNGDRVTGEIKELLLGEVRFNTIALGNISVKWSDIQRIVTDKPMRMQKTDGSYVFGNVAGTDESELIVATAQGEVSLSLKDILYLKPIKEDESLWERMDKNLLVGFSYTQASDIVRWNLGAGLKYDGDDYKTGISMQSLVTNNRAAQETRRAHVTAYYNRNISGVNFWFANASVQTNDELGIDKRLIVSGGGGRFLQLSNSSEVAVQLGIAANRERSTSNSDFISESGISYEGLIHFDWTHFKLHTPKRRLSTSVDYFPGITESSRHRVNYEINYRQEFVADLFFNIELYASYDSEPPDTAISGEDFGMITSLEFRW
jgi:hypothetical protein